MTDSKTGLKIVTPKPKKRFIAGAVCPKCGQMDKLMMYKQDEIEIRECVSCGFKDEMRFKAQPRELQTRVNMTEEMKASEVQVLSLDPAGTAEKEK